jgi:hypothetical protein
LKIVVGSGDLPKESKLKKKKLAAELLSRNSRRPAERRQKEATRVKHYFVIKK